ncbi:hypothetical protein K439DRAFT_1612195 [Ramaria rubella]|nr:hypothetical protein K439DRAFT_1612195 [Ramaria rubella]
MSSLPQIPEIPPPARRVVTGHDGQGKSAVIYDDSEGHILFMENGSRMHTPWFSDSVPVDCSPITAKDSSPHKNFLAANEGSSCVILTAPPGAFFPMNITKSCDYAVILEEIELELGERY